MFAENENTNKYSMRCDHTNDIKVGHFDKAR